MVAGVFIPELLGQFGRNTGNPGISLCQGPGCGRIPRHSAHEAGPLCRLQSLRARLHVGSDRDSAEAAQPVGSASGRGEEAGEKVPDDSLPGPLHSLRPLCGSLPQGCNLSRRGIRSRKFHARCSADCFRIKTVKERLAPGAGICSYRLPVPFYSQCKRSPKS